MTYRTFDGTSQTETIVDGRFSSSGDIALSDGSATQGAIYFADDKNTGIYSPSNDSIAFTTAGSAALTIANNNATFSGDLTAKSLTLTDDETSVDPQLLIKTDDQGLWGFQIRNDAYGTGSEGFKIYQSNAGVNYLQVRGTSARGRLVLQQHNGSTSNDVFECNADGTLDVTPNTTFVSDVFLHNRTSASSATPVMLDLGGQYTADASVSHTNLKFKIYSNSSNNDASGITHGASGLSYVGATNSDHLFYTTDNGEAVGTLNERFRIHRGGDVEVKTGNLKLPATKGIQFSTYGEDDSNAATTVTSNTLSDYEEGTWVPRFSFSTTDSGIDPDVAGCQGRYTKIGRKVYCSFIVELDAIGSAAGNSLIIGLPFTATNDSGDRLNGMVTYYAGMSSISMPIVLYNVTNSTSIGLYSSGAAAVANLTEGNFSNTSHMRGFIEYHAT